jgi:hypothetical protein
MIKRIFRYIKIILKASFIDFEHSLTWEEVWKRSKRK